MFLINTTTRYAVSSVGVLTNKEYLGGKLTIADISFVAWNFGAATWLLGPDFDFNKAYPKAAK